MIDKIEGAIEEARITKLGKSLKIARWEFTGIRTPEGEDILFNLDTKVFILAR